MTHNCTNLIKIGFKHLVIQYGNNASIKIGSNHVFEFITVFVRLYFHFLVFFRERKMFCAFIWSKHLYFQCHGLVAHFHDGIQSFYQNNSFIMPYFYLCCLVVWKHLDWNKYQVLHINNIQSKNCPGLNCWTFDI